MTIGENSIYNNRAFKGIIDEVQLYNYALGPDQINQLYLTSSFRITAAAVEGNDVRLIWQCFPGGSYIVQTNTTMSTGGLAGGFGDLTTTITIPANFSGATTNYLHHGARTNTTAGYYRVKLLP